MYIPPNIKTILDHFDRVRGGYTKITWFHKVDVGGKKTCYVTRAVESTLTFCYDFSFDRKHKDHIETILSIYPLDDVGSVIYVLDDQFNNRYDVTHLLNLHNLYNLNFWMEVLSLMENKHGVFRNP